MWSPEPEWTLRRIRFTADELDENQPRGSWSGHRAFGYDLVRWGNPDRIVELGTHYGVSFFSLCQAVKDGAIVQSLHPIDTWTGDEHAGFYGEDVFDIFRRIIEEEYPELPIQIHRQLFDEARQEFAEGSIDLLHIDGLHTYEAVRHDFETWSDRLADDAIVLFHDIDESTGYGTVDYWREISAQYPSLEFHHSSGLGILFPRGDRWFEPVSSMIQRFGAVTYPVLGGYDRNETEFALARDHAQNLAEKSETLERAVVETREQLLASEKRNGDLFAQLMVARDLAKGADAAKGAALGQLAVMRQDKAAAEYREHLWEVEMSRLEERVSSDRNRLEEITDSRSWRLARLAGLPVRLIRRLSR